LCHHADLAKIFFGLIFVTDADEELALPSPSLSSPVDPCQKCTHTVLSWYPVSPEMNIESENHRMMVRIHLLLRFTLCKS